MRSAVAIAALVGACGVDRGGAPIAKEELGRLVFHDSGLSTPPGQACADCHADATAFADPEDDRTSAGVIRDRVGFRNTPSLMYAAYVPPLDHQVGGLFWDGRADSLEAQVAGPLLNPLEMNNPDKAAVVASIRRAAYAPSFRQVYGPDALDDVDAAFADVADALAAFERTPALAPFASKYDRYLAGDAELDDAEARGLAIFEDPARGGCASCHPSRPGPDGAPPLFTTYAYANLGLPRFGNSPYYALPVALNPEGDAFVDHGLMRTTGRAADDGLFRIPTLRNITRTSPFGHNGYFRQLGDMLDFVANRDLGSTRSTGSCSGAPGVPPDRCAWPAPEVAATVDHSRTGGRGLTDDELADLAAFLATLADP